MDAHLLPWLNRVKSQLNNSIKVQNNIYLNSPPANLCREYNELLTVEAQDFLVNLFIQFEPDINSLYNERQQRRLALQENPKIPRFSVVKNVDVNWQVEPVNNRLKNRHIDLGDVSPSDLKHFTAALCANVQGIQVDFDDGHCPSWYNQIAGLHNVYKAVHNCLKDVPKITQAPILMLRPRAWNMIEHNVSINGRQVPGPIFDFALLIYHNGKILQKINAGPCFYLSKLENYKEAKLWNNIFSWTELRLNIPHGTIKACVLIENILAAFEIEKILYELRDHSLGLNCGIWDYAASIIAKFGNDKSFIIPDRKKYVNMNQKFLKKYLQLVVRICHARGAHATGGMAAAILPNNSHNENYKNILKTIIDGKLAEIREGVDGFMIYDIKLIPAMNELWKQSTGNTMNQLYLRGTEEDIIEEDLLCLPTGGVTLQGLEHNIRVAILFIYHWLNGQGHFILQGFVEDSATAEISRSQIWQWIRHGAKLENDEAFVTRDFVRVATERILKELFENYGVDKTLEKTKLMIAGDLFFDLVNRREFPEFITTFIYNEYPFRRIQSHL